MSLENYLRQATAENQLEVYYQPKIEVNTGIITSAEALVRWHHPTMGMLLPNRFIAVAEDIGYIDTIGNYVLAESFKNALHWLAQGWPLKVSVNITAHHLTHGNLVETVKNLLLRNRSSAALIRAGAYGKPIGR